MHYRSVRKLPVPEDSRIIKDQLNMLKGAKWQGVKNRKLRRVEAWMKLEGEEKERRMVFLTNNTQWSPRSVCDLYRARWEIEVFFKQVKQTLKLGGFLGHSANAIRWQIWIALLVHLLMRYLAWVNKWSHSFVRLFALVRSQLWQRLDLMATLNRYGTAGGSYRNLARPEQGYFAEFT